MAEGTNQVTGVEIQGDNCPVTFNAPVSITACNESLQTQNNEYNQSSRTNLRDLERMNKLLRRSCRKKQRKKINLWSWKNTNVKVTEDYKEEGLFEPDIDVYPQMKKGFRFYKGEWAPKMHETTFGPGSKPLDYVPQQSFSLHAPVHDAEDITLEQLVKSIKKREYRLLSIVGPAGSGKTTLMRRLAKAIMQSSQLSQEHISENFLVRLFKGEVFCNQRPERKYKAVLYFSFKDIPAMKRISVPDLMMKNIFRDISDQKFKEGYLWLLENQSKLLFVMDGLDQSSFQISNKAKMIGHWDEASTSTIIHNLFIGNLFPDAQIVFSSRENSVASLPSQLRPSLVVALVGLSFDDSKKLFISLMGEEGVSAWERIRSTSADLICLSKIPLFLLFMVIVLKNHPNYRMHSMSGVLSTIIEILPKSNNAITGRNLIPIMKKLMKMAFHGLKEKRVTFTHDDLQMFDLDKDIIMDLIMRVPGLNTICQNLFDGDYIFFFCHQIIQEILAAYYIRAMELDEFLDFVNDYLQQDFWFVVFRILYGISLDERVIRIISKDILPDICHEKQDILRKALKRRLKMRLTPLQKLNHLWIISESNDAELLEAHGCKVEVEGFPIPGDGIYAISSLAAHFGGLGVLSLVNCGIDAELLNLMSVCLAGLKFKLFDISDNVISVTGYAALKNLVQNLSIEELVMDFPQRNFVISNSFDLAPPMVPDIFPHIQKCQFKVKARRLFLLQNDLKVLCRQSFVMTLNELHISIEKLDQSTIDDISNIIDQLKIGLQGNKPKNFFCYLMVELWQLKNNSDGIKMLQNFIILTESFKGVILNCLSLWDGKINDNFVNILKTISRCVSIEKFDVSLNRNISDISWGWLGQVVSQFEIKYFGASKCGLTDSKLMKFIEAANGTKIYHLDVTFNYRITPQGWFHIGRMLKQNGLKVLGADSNLLDREKFQKFLDGADEAQVDILLLDLYCEYKFESGVIAEILEHVREDIVISYSNEDGHTLLNELCKTERVVPKVWQAPSCSLTCPDRRIQLTVVTINQFFLSDHTPNITLTWKPPPNHGHCIYDIEAQIGSETIKYWKNYEGTSLVVTSLPTEGTLQFKIHTRLCYGLDMFVQPVYSKKIDLQRLQKN